MKVLVTGNNGKFVKYLKSYASKNKRDWEFDFISLRTDSWRQVDMSSYDAVFHCAGITSAPGDDYKMFKKINVTLTEELFRQAIEQRAKQFVYLSSMAVYDGVGWGFGKEGLITLDTEPRQKTNYGKSKYEAEKAIKAEMAGNTKVSIIRAPSIVGGGMEAYFARYVKFARIPFIPIPVIHEEAKRSFVYVDTLIEFVCNIIQNTAEGVFFPQQYPPLSVSEMMSVVCEAMGKPKIKSKIVGRIIPGAIQNRFFSQICYDSKLNENENRMVPYISSKEAIIHAINE
ncbi:MAG: NAD-dependent epimerase/dehydratase family protein [Lachnospiraceae bacterium]|nr:NAD-dependent epimerase/dehydratase family protein [Lachnospiraceae bacterium]